MFLCYSTVQPPLECPTIVSSSSAQINSDSNWISDKAKATIYKIIILFPKLALSGAGWVIGCGFGFIFGAAVGDAVGTAVGGIISFGIESLLLGAGVDPKLLGIDETLLKEGGKEVDWKKLIQLRSVETFQLACGSLIGGGIFNQAIKVTQFLAIKGFNIIQPLIAGLITSIGFTAGMTGGRALYTGAYLLFHRNTPIEHNSLHHRLKWSFKHVESDFKLGLKIIWPAQAFFAATSFPVAKGLIWLTKHKLSIWKGAGSVVVGGSIGVGASAFLSHFKDKRKREETPPPEIPNLTLYEKRIAAIEMGSANFDGQFLQQI